MRPVARKIDVLIASMGCVSYVKTIKVVYDIGGEMVAALYGHADHVEVALAVAEDHPDTRLLDASHLTWRTLPLALNLKKVSEVSECQALFQEACDRVREQTHDVHRDNYFFVGRKQRGAPRDS